MAPPLQRRGNNPHIWLLTDGKPGHRNQLRGLADRLTALGGLQCHWLSVPERGPTLWQCWRGVNLAPQLPAPALVIAAGSGTQRALLASGRCFHCPTVLLMRPNFPYAWVDAAIVPAHDNPPVRSNIFVTRGVQNAVQPVDYLTSELRGLLLIGGISTHFGWDQPDLIEQILTLCRETPHWQWVLTDSRRTPGDFLPALTAVCPPNLTLTPHAETTPAWLPNQLAASARAWVTPDSVSMVYEALTAGIPTGLFELPEGRAGRIVRGLRQLLDDGLVTPFARRAELGASGEPPSLWEADRTARWLLRRFFSSGNSDSSGNTDNGGGGQ